MSWFMLCRAGGKFVSQLVDLKVVRNGAGQIVGLRGTVQDVTEREQAEVLIAAPEIAPVSPFASNWHQRPREETMILGELRGPRTKLRLSPEQTIEAGLKFLRLVEVPPYHYGAVFERSVS
jgi:hypothetical protein